MGAGASTTADPRYVAPVTREDANGELRTLFLAVPLNDAVRAKATQVLLEVGPKGFRLLRLGTEVPLYDFPFAHVHSWGHLPDKFSFKFFDDKTKAIVLYTFQCKLVDALLKAIHGTIDSILSDRKNKSMGDADFEALLAQISGPGAANALSRLKSVTATTFFTSTQGERLVAALPSAFDRVEAACLLHFALVDQNRFSCVLRPLEAAEDRENVLHRVQAEKAKRNAHKTNAASVSNPIRASPVASPSYSPSPPSSPAPGFDPTSPAAGAAPPADDEFVN